MPGFGFILIRREGKLRGVLLSGMAVPSSPPVLTLPALLRAPVLAADPTLPPPPALPPVWGGSLAMTSFAFFGSDAYSNEELIAEIGAAALVNRCGLETAQSFRNSAAYIQNWLQALKNDKRFIISVAGKAEKAVALIVGE